jgi:hypothetical protein
MESATLGPAIRTALSLVVLTVVFGVGAVWQTPAVSLSLTNPDTAILLTPLALVCTVCSYLAVTG